MGLARDVSLTRRWAKVRLSPRVWAGAGGENLIEDSVGLAGRADRGSTVILRKRYFITWILGLATVSESVVRS